jgi:hypothetical protein
MNHEAEKYECLINWYDQSDTIVLQESYYTRENSLIDQNAYGYTKLILPPFGNIRCFSFVKWVYLDIFRSNLYTKNV